MKWLSEFIFSDRKLFCLVQVRAISTNDFEELSVFSLDQCEFFKKILLSLINWDLLFTNRHTTIIRQSQLHLYFGYLEK